MEIWPISYRPIAIMQNARACISATSCLHALLLPNGNLTMSVAGCPWADIKHDGDRSVSLRYGNMANLIQANRHYAKCQPKDSRPYSYRTIAIRQQVNLRTMCCTHACHWTTSQPEDSDSGISTCRHGSLTDDREKRTNIVIFYSVTKNCRQQVNLRTMCCTHACHWTTSQPEEIRS
jgi:hypothetical protein